MIIMNEKNNNQFEHCVLCRKVVSIDKNTHIDLRDNYIEGIGQLCPDCFYKISPGTNSLVNED